MNRTAALVAVSFLLLVGCGSDPKEDSASDSTFGESGVAEVGKDLRPGIYTSKNDCLAFTATTREFTLDDEEPVGDYTGGSLIVRDVYRIVLTDGDFFHVSACLPSAWKRESDDGEKSVDPATISGACTLMIEDKLLDQVLTYALPNKDDDEVRRQGLQDRLMSIVTAGTFADPDKDSLAEPVGQLVDFLDDPEEYVEGGKLIPLVSGEVDKIKKTCD